MKVKVISTEKKAAIVEYVDAENSKRRCIIPEESLRDGNVVRDELLSASIPYGVDWEFQLEGIIGKVTPELIQEEFHRVGLWTAEDVINNARAVHGVLQTVYGYDFAGIINIAKSLLKK